MTSSDKPMPPVGSAKSAAERLAAARAIGDRVRAGSKQNGLAGQPTDPQEHRPAASVGAVQTRAPESTVEMGQAPSMEAVNPFARLSGSALPAAADVRGSRPAVSRADARPPEDAARASSSSQASPFATIARQPPNAAAERPRLEDDDEGVSSRRGDTGGRGSRAQSTLQRLQSKLEQTGDDRVVCATDCSKFGRGERGEKLCFDNRRAGAPRELGELAATPQRCPAFRP